MRGRRKGDRNRHVRAALVVALCAGAVLVAGVGVTLGQGSTGDRPVRACVDSRTGALRLVAAGRSCGRRSRALSWNVRGETGRPGPDGAPGPPGAAGATGNAGSDGAQGSFNFDDFDGMSCDAGSGPDTVTVSYDSNGFATFQC